MSLQEFVKDKPTTQCKVCNLPESVLQEVNENLVTRAIQRRHVIEYVWETTGVEITPSSYDRHSVHVRRTVSV